MPATKKKKVSFFAKLKPTTRKAKILSTVAMFAIVGGVMVYKSFAATTLYTWPAANFNCDISNASNFNCKKVTDPQKNGAVYALMTNAERIQQVDVTKAGDIRVALNAKYSVCVTAKGVGTLYLNDTSGLGSYATTNPVNFTNSNAFETKCKTLTARSARRANGLLDCSTFVYNGNPPYGPYCDLAITTPDKGDGSTYLLVSQVTMGTVDSPITPTTTSNPAK